MGKKSGSPPKFNRFFFGPRPPLQKISSKSVHNFFLDILTDRQTDTHTDTQTDRYENIISSV